MTAPTSDTYFSEAAVMRANRPGENVCVHFIQHLRQKCQIKWVTNIDGFTVHKSYEAWVLPASSR